MKMFKRLLAVVCSLAIIATITSSFPISNTFVRAEDVQPTSETNKMADLPVVLEENGKFMSGYIGKNVTYELYNNGNLVISGEGKTNEYSYNRTTVTCNTPWWYYHRNKIRSVFVSDKVTRLGNHLFYDCYNLEKVYISDGVTEIGDSVFGGCRKLTTISIPDSVVDIGENAFDCCNSLANVVLPNGLSKISDNMFFYCDSLTSVTIPESVTSVGIQAFYHCDKLKDVFFSGTKEQWDKISIASNNRALKNATIHYNSTDSDILENETKPLSGKCGDNLIWMLDDKGVLTISGTGEMHDYDYANLSPWSSSNVVSVNINNGVTSIGNCAFGLPSHGLGDNCRDVFVPKSLKHIGDEAFGSAKYTNIFYPGSKEEWNNISKPDMADDTLLTSICHFNHNTSHEDSGISGTCGAHLSWTLDDNGTLTISGSGEMYGFTGLETMAPWWKSVLNSVFNKSMSVKNVIIENGVSSIGANAFGFSECEDMENIRLPESVVTIGGGAFLGCTRLTSIYITKGTTEIFTSSGRSGDTWGTFENCSSLSEINVDGDNQCYKSINGILFNKDGTELIAYPVGDTKPKYLIPSGVKTVGNCAFFGCKNLKSVIIPNSVTSIGGGAFGKCTELTEISIPNSVSELGWQTFTNCTSLTTVTIPDSVISIGYEAFAGCSNLKDVYYSGTKTEWNKISIDSVNDNLTNATIHYNHGPDDFSEVETENRNLCIIGFTFYEVPMEIKWGGGLFEHSSSVYDNNLAIAACALSGLAENLESDLPTKDLLSRMGFGNSSMQSDKFNEWNPYNPAYVFANRDIVVNGKNKKLISVTIRGSQTIWGDWVFSDFYDGVFSGFTASTNFIYDALSDYMVREGLDSLPKEDIVFFISGHSLGGAVAAKLTTECISRGLALQDNTYTYTIAASRYSNSTKQNKYSNIFELINIYDKVPNLGFPGNPTGTSHYGMWEEFDANQVADFYKYWNLWEDGTLEHKEWGRNHGTPAYMSYLLTKEFYTNTTVTKRRDKSYLISVRCPVDVEIYDTDDNLLGKVINNTVDESVSNETVSCKIEGDEKYFFIESDKEIYVKLTGTGRGTMEYSVQKLKSVDEVATEDDFVTYKNVVLKKDKEFYSDITKKDGTANVSLYIIDPETNKPVKFVGLDGKETNLAEKSNIWLYITGVVLIVIVTVTIVLIFRKKHKKQ